MRSRDVQIHRFASKYNGGLCRDTGSSTTASAPESQENDVNFGARFLSEVDARWKLNTNSFSGATAELNGDTLKIISRWPGNAMARVAGQVAVGILTAGADNRMGRLIQQLGNRNLLQVKMDPMYRLAGRDIFAERLGNDPANFSFNTIALPMDPEPGCDDCAIHRQPQHRAA